MIFKKPSFTHLVPALLMAGTAAVAQAQVIARFTGDKPEPGWAFHGTAAMSAPAADSAGNGWLRLTGNVNQAGGVALLPGAKLSAANGLTLSFEYVSWGGGAPGADGISVFLYDAAGDMSGGLGGGALGYCRAAGAWLGLGLDEYGNFSNPGVGCNGGPGTKPQSLVLRGPTAQGNPFVAGVAVPGGLDQPAAQARPQANHVTLNLQPKVQGTGFLVTVDLRRGAGPWTRVLDRVDFPFAAPAALNVGLAAATGGAKNIHEVRAFTVQAQKPPVVNHLFDPPEVAVGAKSMWVLQMGSTDGSSTALLEPLVLKLAPGVRVATPTVIGGTCPGSVSAQPGGETVTLEKGSAVRPAGCTITVEVVPTRAGSFTSAVPAGALVTDKGMNVQPSTATLIAK